MKHESNGHIQTRNNRKDFDAAFRRTIQMYVVALLTPGLGACHLDGQPKRILAPGTTILDFKIDAEIAAKRVLTTPELQAEWRRLVREEINAAQTASQGRNPLPISAEQRELTNRVIMACGKIFARRGLDRLSYFRKVRKRVDR